MQRIDYRFVQLPLGLLNDERLSSEHVHAYGIMLDASREGRCLISARRLGQRLQRSEDTGRRVIRKLVETGWLETIDLGNGKCRAYWLLTPSIAARGTDTQTPGTHAGGGNPNPLHPCHPTPSTGATHSIRNSINDVRTLSEKDGNETRQRLVTILNGCGYNGRAEREADIALGEFDSAADVERLIAWTLYASKTDTIRNPIAFATSEARKGGNPPSPRSQGSPYPTFGGLDAEGNLVMIPAKAHA